MTSEIPLPDQESIKDIDVQIEHAHQNNGKKKYDSGFVLDALLRSAYESDPARLAEKRREKIEELKTIAKKYTLPSNHLSLDDNGHAGVARKCGSGLCANMDRLIDGRSQLDLELLWRGILYHQLGAEKNVGHSARWSIALCIALHPRAVYAQESRTTFKSIAAFILR